MSDQISTAFVKQFGDNIMMLSQQRGSKLRDTVMQEPNVTGEVAFMDQIGPTEAQRVTTRHADSPQVDTPHERRRVSLIDIEWGDLIDDFDRLKTLIDPQSAYSQNAAWAIGREVDEIIIENYFSDAVVGKEGNSTVSFPSGQQVDATVGSSASNSGGSSANGLNIQKLIQARGILRQNNVDLEAETPTIVVKSDQTEDLLGLEEITSADFNTVRALVNGEVNTFMGFNFVHTELLNTDGSGDVRVPVYVRSGMGMAEAQAPTARISERPDKRYSTYIYYSTSMGATRLEEEKVVEIKCSPKA
jgi:hypothetical protein